MSFLDFQMKLSWKNLLKWSFLKGLSLIFSCLVWTRLSAYRNRIQKGWSANKRVISVGNITVGGTGKTPMVDWFLSFLVQRGIKPAVLTRGYKAQRSENVQILSDLTAEKGNCLQFGDEPWLLFRNHPDISLYISPDRVEAAKQAQIDADILLLDDGMQHLQLNRDLEIIMIDAVSGLGNGHLIPLGPLREPLSSLARANVVIFTKTNLESSQKIRQQIAPFLHSDIRQFDGEYLPDQLIPSDNSLPLSPTVIKNKRCLLFSGIGNPRGFFKTIESTGAAIEEHLIFDDHQEYNTDALERIKQLAKEQSFDYLICTEKDWVKLETRRNDLPVVHRLKMKMKIDPDFIHFVDEWLARNMPTRKMP